MRFELAQVSIRAKRVQYAVTGATFWVDRGGSSGSLHFPRETFAHGIYIES